MTLKKIVLLSLSLIICIGSFSQSKLINAGKSGKISETIKTHSAKSAKKKSSSSTQTNSKNDSQGDMNVNDIVFANIDDCANIINDYGSELFVGDVKYLKGKVFYNGLVTAVKEMTLWVKIVKEDGTVVTGMDSPNGYTFKTNVKIEPGSGKSFELSGFGNNLATSFAAGLYNYEIWNNDKLIFQKKIRLYSGKTPLVNHKLIKIHAVNFANVDNSGNILNPYGSTFMENEVQYLKPQIMYEGFALNDQHVTLMTRIVLPDGNIAKGTESPLGFTYKNDFTIQKGRNTSTLIGWGNDQKQLYPKGTYQYEIWLDGSKIFETNFTINRKNESFDLLEEQVDTNLRIASRNSGGTGDYLALMITSDKQELNSKTTNFNNTFNSVFVKKNTFKRHRFAIDLGFGGYYIFIGDSDVYEMFDASTTLRYIYNFNKNFGLDTDLTLMSDFAETTGGFISVGPRLSTNPSKKNFSLYFVPKIGYGAIEDFGSSGLSYEMEFGINFGKNLFVSYSYIGQSTYVDYYRFEEEFNFSAHSIRFGVYF